MTMRRLLRAALRALTHPALADAIDGDLEELRRAHAGRSRLAAAFWFWSEAARILLHIAGRRVRVRARSAIAWRPRPARFVADFRYAARSLRGSPWYAGTVVGVLALGIALSTTVFAVVDGVLFKPLPYRDAHELYLAYGRDSTNTRRGAIRLSPMDVRDWAAVLPQARFAMFVMMGDISTFGVVNGRPVSAAFIDPDFLDVLGIRPVLGGFEPGDFVVSSLSPLAPRGRDPSTIPRETLPALVGYGFWQRFFGGEVAAIGQTFSAPDVPQLSFRLAGVLPADAVFPADRDQPEILLPLGVPAAAFEKRVATVSVIARLPDTTAMSEYQTRLDAAMRAALPEYPPSWQFDSVRLSAVTDALGGTGRRPFAVVFGAAAGLALLACVNVAGLSIARASNRRRDFALRRALGASARDLWRPVLAEVSLLMLAASVAGVALAKAGLETVVRLLPADLMLYKTAEIDVRVVGFVLIVGAASTLVIGVAAARAGSRAGLAGTLAGASLAATARGGAGRFSIVAIQIGATLVLALGGTLLVASLVRVFGEDPGFDVDRTLSLSVHLGAAPRPVMASRLDVLLEEVRRQSGVQEVGALDSWLLTRSYVPPPVEWPEHAKAVRAESVPVASGFFQLAGIELVSGRLPTPAELDSGTRLAVVSEKVAGGFWPDRPAVGQSLLANKWAESPGPFEVVAVVRDARLQALDAEPVGQIYLPIAVLGAGRAPTILVRTTPGARDVEGRLIRAVGALGSSYSLQRIEPLRARVRDSVRLRVFQAWLFGIFAVSALALMSVGVFGLIAMTVGHRGREMAIRIALGSTRVGLIRLLVCEQLRAVVAGLVAGGLVAAWAARLLESYVYEITVYDSRVWTLAIVVVTLAALSGALLPSWRASRHDSIQALRAD
jgi:predicted permease